MHAKCPSHMLYHVEKMKCDKAERVPCEAGQGQVTKAPEETLTTVSTRMTASTGIMNSESTREFTETFSTTEGAWTTTSDVQISTETSQSTTNGDETSSTKDKETTTSELEKEVTTDVTPSITTITVEVTTPKEESTTEELEPSKTTTVESKSSTTEGSGSTSGYSETTQGGDTSLSSLASEPLTSTVNNEIETEESSTTTAAPLISRNVRQLITAVNPGGPWTVPPPASKASFKTASVCFVAFLLMMVKFFYNI